MKTISSVYFYKIPNSKFETQTPSCTNTLFDLMLAAMRFYDWTYREFAGAKSLVHDEIAYECRQTPQLI